MKKLKKYRFTLIEIVVVMALMAALLALMLPSFNKMINGSKVDQMASNIKLGLEKAQSLAVTERRYVAVIFPSNSANWSNFNWSSNTQFCLGGYRLAYVKDVSGSTSTFVKWVPDKEWENEPSGAYLVRLINHEEMEPLIAGNEWDSGVASAVTKFTDALKDKNNNELFLTVRGVLNASGSSVDKENCAVIFSPYGGIMNAEMGLVIAEGVSAGDELKYPNKIGSNPANFVILGINKFSGRVEYLQR